MCGKLNIPFVDIKAVNSSMLWDIKTNNFISAPINGGSVTNILNQFILNSGKVLAFIHDHTHCDNIITPVQSCDLYPDITILCSLCYTTSVPNILIGQPSVQQRMYNTYLEFVINVYVINYKTGNINIFRFGAMTDYILMNKKNKNPHSVLSECGFLML